VRGKVSLMLTHASEIIMFKIPVAVEVKTDQDCDYLRIGHHAFTYWSVF